MLNEQEPKISLQDYWKDFPEAPFSDTFKWIDADGFEHMTTVRGWGDKSLSDGINKAKALIQYNGGRPANGRTPPPAMVPVATSAPQPIAAPQPTVAAPAAVDTGINTMEIVKVKVTPKPNDAVELALFAANHQYPDLYHNGTVNQVVAALAGTGLAWDASALRIANEYNVNFYADWRNSEKLNTKGKPYKNIVGYRAIDATA